MISFKEILVILLIVVILFGASQIPKIARSLGEGIKEFKKGIKEAKDHDKDHEKEENNKS
ncbi:MAG: twin-arginine translocase TatA/TatE family subunit [Spirochaetes bacterium]|nr:twin-arginine translocase TatA/TatE family subunit [Spirochaetota bacterium]